jgi:hypothetical protein
MRPRRWLRPIRCRISRNNCLKHEMCSTSCLLHSQVSALVLGMSIFFTAWAWRWWVAGPLSHHCPGQHPNKTGREPPQIHRKWSVKLPEHSGRLAALSLGATGVLLLVPAPSLTGKMSATRFQLPLFFLGPNTLCFRPPIFHSIVQTYGHPIGCRACSTAPGTR